MVKIFVHFLIYQEARSHLNFLLCEENLVFFFISVKSKTTVIESKPLVHEIKIVTASSMTGATFSGFLCLFMYV
jgi:hypothetical protein